MKSTCPYVRTIAGSCLLFALSSCLIERDDFNSRVSCAAYCDKHFACQDENPTAVASRECVDTCRDAIEDDCGNEHQAAVNAQLMACKERSCGEFAACMVFEAAPECLCFFDE